MFISIGVSLQIFADTPAFERTTLFPNSENWFHRLRFGIEGEMGGNVSYAGNQIVGQAIRSLQYDILDSCQKQVRPGCIKGYVIFPRLAVGGYHDSKLSFTSLSLGVGVQVMMHQEVGWIFQTGLGGQFSYIGSLDEQQSQEIGRVYKRDPNDSLLFMGFIQTGLQWDVGEHSSSPWLKGFSLQATAKLQNGPHPYPAQQDEKLIYASKYNTLDVNGVLGVFYRFPRLH